MFCCIVTIICVILIAIFNFVSQYFKRGYKSGGSEDITFPYMPADGKNTFPYKRKWMGDKIATTFENIKNYEFNLVHKPYKILNMPHFTDLVYKPLNLPTIIECKPADYYDMNWLSDYFNEQCRQDCKRYDEDMTPHEYWSLHKDELQDLPPSQQSDKVYENIIGCGNFRPGLLVGMIKHLKEQFDLEVKLVLDPCSGWGDRLIGAIAAGVNYIGVDPNPCLVDGYQAIIDRFADGGEYKMIKSEIQTAQLDCNPDLVFTSPPYFDLEVYPGSTAGSLDMWINDFLYPMLKKCYDVLNPGGVQCMVINDVRDGPKYVEKMLEIMDGFGAEYLGVMSYADYNGKYHKSPQPIWMWRKNEPPLNPKIITEQIEGFTVVRDDLLQGGTKQRGLTNLKLPPGTTEIVYAGPWNGYAQVALAVAAPYYKVKSVCFMTRSDYETNIKAKELGGEFVVIPGADLKQLQAAAEKYCNVPSRYLLPFGFANEEIISTLYNNIKKASTIDLSYEGTIWLVGGSATLLNVLERIYEKANFSVVQVGKTIWPDQISTRTKIYNAPEKFYDDAITPPPYPSARKYDAKCWQFVKQFGKPNDIIWNVAA